MDAALKKVIERHGIKSVEKLGEIKDRRKFVDDISIVAVNLDEVGEKYLWRRGFFSIS
jgi:hypothetical protein